MKMTSLQDLFIDSLRDLYNAENQIIKALPKMAKAADSEELQNAFQEHLEQTKEHVERLEKVFEIMGTKARGKTCQAMEGLIEEGKELMKEDAEPEVLDAGLIAAAQKVEHYEMASYGTVRTWAQQLGQDAAAELLQQTLDEEMDTDRKLSNIAESMVNASAAQGQAQES
ncbi:MAG: ferritin-like domain-containing protein [Gemmataceae bacterium]